VKNKTVDVMQRRFQCFGHTVIIAVTFFFEKFTLRKFREATWLLFSSPNSRVKSNLCLTIINELHERQFPTEFICMIFQPKTLPAFSIVNENLGGENKLQYQLCKSMQENVSKQMFNYSK
jgi:hypothetical protein